MPPTTFPVLVNIPPSTWLLKPETGEVLVSSLFLILHVQSDPTILSSEFVFFSFSIQNVTFTFFKKNEFIYLFIYYLATLGLHCYVRAFSSCGERGLLFVAVRGLLIVVASLCCRAWALGAQAQQLWLVGSRAQVQQLWCMGLVAPRHVGSSWTRARTRVPCIGRWILNHCTTSEVPRMLLLKIYLYLFFTLLFFYCRIVDLQCCVSFRCTAN